MTADANGPYYGLINMPVEFSGRTDFGYPPYTWHWDFGDDIGTSDEQDPAYSYSAPGTYTVISAFNISLSLSIPYLLIIFST